jgi:S-methylmethionine-dependent homocysteine/selenocysteine methylase
MIPRIGVMAKEIVVLDGAMGTLLATRGVRTDGPAWSARAIVEAPDAVSEIHSDYARAGATLHTANTFRATAEPLIRAAVALARRSVPADHRVAGSMASVADCYRPSEVPVDARPAHRRHAEALAAAGVDLLLCETFANIDEAIVAVEEGRRTGVEVWAAFSAGPGASLLDPATVRRGAERAIGAGASCVLVNCTSARLTLGYVEALAGLPVPIGAYANVGDPGDGLGFIADWGLEPPDVEEQRASAERYADLAGSWIAAGATVVGGCCGTGPAHIAALAHRWAGHIPPSRAY